MWFERTETLILEVYKLPSNNIFKYISVLLSAGIKLIFS